MKKITPTPPPNYTLDQMLEVWSLSMVHGATIYKYCQDNKIETKDFDTLIKKLLKFVKTETDLKGILSNQAIMLGICHDLHLKKFIKISKD